MTNIPTTRPNPTPHPQLRPHNFNSTANANRSGIGADILLEWKNLGLRLPSPELVHSRKRPAVRTPNRNPPNWKKSKIPVGRLQDKETLPNWTKLLLVTCILEQPQVPQVTPKQVHRRPTWQSITAGTRAAPLLLVPT